MSVFKAEWIVLQVMKISEKELLYKVLFRDYGILKVKKKKKIREKPIDIGHLIHSEIATQTGREIHSIGNIKIISFFDSKQRLYSDIERFLKILSRTLKELPIWSPHYEIFDLLSYLIKNIKLIGDSKLLLTQLKLIACLWSLPETHLDPTTWKILKFIHSHNYKDVMRLWEVPEDTVRLLQNMTKG